MALLKACPIYHQLEMSTAGLGVSSIGQPALCGQCVRGTTDPPLFVEQPEVWMHFLSAFEVYFCSYSSPNSDKTLRSEWGWIWKLSLVCFGTQTHGAQCGTDTAAAVGTELSAQGISLSRVTGQCY